MVSNKLCAYCDRVKKIFKNTPLGKQCWDCWRKSQLSPKKLTNKKTNKVDRSLLEKEIDSKFSMYIRLKYSHTMDLSPMVRKVFCYTCGKECKLSEIQCGHYIGRGVSRRTRWMEENCRPQCKECNELNHGRIEEFAKRLELESPGLTEKLRILSHEPIHYTEAELIEIKENLRLEVWNLLHSHQRDEILREKTGRQDSGLL